MIVCNLYISYVQSRHYKLLKARKFLTLLCMFESEYTLYKSVAIDEAMISFKVCMGLKLYLKDNLSLKSYYNIFGAELYLKQQLAIQKG